MVKRISVGLRICFWSVWALAGLLTGPTLGQQEVIKMSTQSEHSEYELVPAEVRNIIFVGRTRSGKSTIIEVMKNKTHSPEKIMRVLRGTEHATVSSFTMATFDHSKNVHFNIMDTPGLFEKTTSLEDRRTNEVILGMIKKCVDKEITKINHVYFVMALTNGLNSEDLKAFALLAELFVGMEGKLSIIISHSQTIAPDEYPEYIQQFSDDAPELKSIYKKIGGRIFFVGAAQVTKFNEKDIDSIRENVFEQRNILFDHIIKETTTFNVKELNMYKENMRFLSVIKTECLQPLCQYRVENDTQCCDNGNLERFDDFIRFYVSSDDGKPFESGQQAKHRRILQDENIEEQTKNREIDMLSERVKNWLETVPSEESKENSQFDPSEGFFMLNEIFQHNDKSQIYEKISPLFEQVSSALRQGYARQQQQCKMAADSCEESTGGWF